MAMARASLVRSLVVWLQVLQQLYRMMAPQGVIIPAPAGGTPGSHTHVCLLKPEWVFNVIAHVRDWEHAETVRRRCLRTVGGFVLQVECTGPG